MSATLAHWNRTCSPTARHSAVRARSLPDLSWAYSALCAPPSRAERRATPEDARSLPSATCAARGGATRDRARAGTDAENRLRQLALALLRGNTGMTPNALRVIPNAVPPTASHRAPRRLYLNVPDEACPYNDAELRASISDGWSYYLAGLVRHTSASTQATDLRAIGVLIAILIERADACVARSAVF